MIFPFPVCEPTAVGFPVVKDSKLSANNVQCIHTNTGGFGTPQRNCHQDWSMGVCGQYQVAQGPYPKGSHGLCPFFYNSAFENNFYAVTKSPACLSTKQAKSWPTKFKMGYLEDRFVNVTGEFFAETTKAYPYNNDITSNSVVG